MLALQPGHGSVIEIDFVDGSRLVLVLEDGLDETPEVADALIETVVATASLRDAGRTLARLRRLGLTVEEREAAGDRIVRIQQPG